MQTTLIEAEAPALSVLLWRFVCSLSKHSVWHVEMDSFLFPRLFVFRPGSQEHEESREDCVCKMMFL